MKGKWIILLLPLLPGCVDATAKETMSKAQATFKPIPAQAPAIKGNEATKAKVDLGRMLFFDPRLSTSQLISCNTCHNVGLGGADLQETSVGHGWQKGPRNAPTVFNAVYNVAQFWDGRAKDLQTQAKGPVQASVEMNSNPELVVRTLKNIPGYPALFEAAFPGYRDPVTFDNMAKAIEVFEATLVTPDAPFDHFLNGEPSALNAREQTGLGVFMEKGCAACHGGINIGGAAYYPFGVREIPTAEIRPESDTGRFKVTNTASDKYVFRAPSLRNVALTQPYFHSGKVWSLKDAVVVMGSAQLGMKLNETEVNDTVAFLKSLTGKQPKIDYPLLPPSSDQTPHPQLK
ncbi:cytochrome c peroxidase [Citrifermentans bemidjiense Bem]|uniref:Cytochrome c peroxidase n=1 Tax=Citrifermentans bemidjiense (strain ATCC BAA-1014 / DSM 16622 / JCM 12645 / Bem) TaxID=404380 RepID=B5E7Q0_CITBB|nr:cytochrome-c peroxidase [Citrifermentans bemidjiense]ACH37051.1 cytochrome c peroxidase [Citrifermentans bemidjiense Bem]